MRDWNQFRTGKKPVETAISTLPMRDWNSFPSSLEPSSVLSFPLYLWEIETWNTFLKANPKRLISTLPMRDWNFFLLILIKNKLKPFPLYLWEIETLFLLLLCHLHWLFPLYLWEIETNINQGLKVQYLHFHSTYERLKPM